MLRQSGVTMPPRPGVAVAIVLGSAGISAAVATPALCLFGKTKAQKQAETEYAEDAKAAAEEAELRRLIQQTRAFAAGVCRSRGTQGAIPCSHGAQTLFESVSIPIQYWNSL
jgi:hypothetical protein